MEKEKLECVDAMELAASVVGRTAELIDDGWMKGKFYDNPVAPARFCVLGAIEVAVDELKLPASVAGKIREIACSAIVEEITGKKGDAWNIPEFNDAGERTLDEVLGVLGRAEQRLWSIAMHEEQVDLSAYQNIGTQAIEQKQAYLYNVLN